MLWIAFCPAKFCRPVVELAGEPAGEFGTVERAATVEPGAGFAGVQPAAVAAATCAGVVVAFGTAVIPFKVRVPGTAAGAGVVGFKMGMIFLWEMC